MKIFKLFFSLYFLLKVSNDIVFAADTTQKWQDKITSMFSMLNSQFFINLFLAIAIIVFTFFLAKFFSSKAWSYLENTYQWEWSWKQEVIWVATRVVNIAILSTWFALVLSVMWIDMGLFLWWLWFWIWFTFKIFLTNFISWVIMVSQWMYKNWDLIEIWWRKWRIQRIYSLFTAVKLFDWEILSVPNIKFLEENVSNYNRNDRRRLKVEVAVDYHTDIVKAKKIIVQVAKQFPDILEKPEPKVTVDKLDNSSINLIVRFWIDTKTWTYLTTKSNVTETINLAFRQSWITIPFPQLTLSNRENFLKNNK